MSSFTITWPLVIYIPSPDYFSKHEAQDPAVLTFPFGCPIDISNLTYFLWLDSPEATLRWRFGSKCLIKGMFSGETCGTQELWTVA